MKHRSAMRLASLASFPPHTVSKNDLNPLINIFITITKHSSLLPVLYRSVRIVQDIMTGRLSFADVASASAKASPPTARTSQEPPPTTGESLDDNKASKSTDAKDTTGAVSESPNWRALGWTNGSQRKVVHHHGKPGYPHLTNFDEKSRFGRVFSVISRKIGIAWPRSCIGMAIQLLSNGSS